MEVSLVVRKIELILMTVMATMSQLYHLVQLSLQFLDPFGMQFQKSHLVVQVDRIERYDDVH